MAQKSNVVDHWLSSYAWTVVRKAMANNFWSRNPFGVVRNLLVCVGSWKLNRILAVQVSYNKIFDNQALPTRLWPCMVPKQIFVMVLVASIECIHLHWLVGAFLYHYNSENGLQEDIFFKIKHLRDAHMSLVHLQRFIIASPFASNNASMICS